MSGLLLYCRYVLTLLLLYFRSQRIRWITNLTHSVSSGLIASVIKCGLFAGDAQRPSLADALSEVIQGLCAGSGRLVCRWDLIQQLLQSVWNVLVKCEGEGVSGCDLSTDVTMARCHLGLALVHLLCPSRPLDPLMVNRAKLQLYQLMVCAYHEHVCQCDMCVTSPSLTSQRTLSV